jgi:hypothetical protein
VIPDDPDYRKHIPIEYRLDAKKIVGELAQDLKKGKSAFEWIEAAHGVAVVAEIFGLAEGVGLVAGGLAVAGPALALAVSLGSLGLGYQEAAEKIAEDWAASGFSRGVVMGADGKRQKTVKEFFGNLYFPRNPVFEHGRAVAMANHKAGLVAGYLQGRLLTANQRQIFFHDLGRRWGDQSDRWPEAPKTSHDLRNWYTDLAAVFRGYHLEPAG